MWMSTMLKFRACCQSSRFRCLISENKFPLRRIDTYSHDWIFDSFILNIEFVSWIWILNTIITYWIQQLISGLNKYGLEALSVLMLCAPVSIFISGSSALLGRPCCGLSIWLSLLSIFSTLFWVYANLVLRVESKLFFLNKPFHFLTYSLV